MDPQLIFLCLLATIGEFIDSGLGMMYGTILSPLLILIGYSPEVVIPSILFSQIFHHYRVCNLLKKASGPLI